MKRSIRQRCGFGCVVCGFPFYDYEHMFGFKKRHVASEITLLCKEHHDEKERKLLTLDAVRRADQHPFNKGYEDPRRYSFRYSGSSCELLLGSCNFTSHGFANGNQFIAVALDRIPMVAFTYDQGRLFLTLLVFDDKNVPVLWIEENELCYSITPWDIEITKRNIVVREKERDLLIDIVFDPPNRIHIRRGRLLLNGLELLITPDHVCFANNMIGFANCGFVGDVGLMCGEPIEGSGGVHIPVTNRGPVDRNALHKWMRQISDSVGAL